MFAPLVRAFLFVCCAITFCFCCILEACLLPHRLRFGHMRILFPECSIEILYESVRLGTWDSFFQNIPQKHSMNFVWLGTWDSFFQRVPQKFSMNLSGWAHATRFSREFHRISIFLWYFYIFLYLCAQRSSLRQSFRGTYQQEPPDVPNAQLTPIISWNLSSRNRVIPEECRWVLPPAYSFPKEKASRYAGRIAEP